ncbi:MAG: phytanoyl-CoA dioxygenase family protein [Chitinophagales bacterium]|nr:phytanoyl-CoA dioxygenase family protein [Chitinophagales bacterium]
MQILKEQNFDKQLLEKGYVIVPFLDEQTVSELKTFYYENHPQGHEGMYATAHVSDISFRIKMNDFIKEKFQKSIDQYFQNCNPLGGSYIAKAKGGNGALVPHQDWNIVDETVYRSFNIWVPLVDLNENNGALMIEPGSHLWDFNYRSANIPFAYPEKEESLWKNMLSLRMKAGESLIYDHRLIHASPENHTDEIRLACVYGIIPEGAQMYYYHKNEHGDIEEYESNTDFFLYGNIFEGPKGLKREKVIKLKKRNRLLSMIRSIFEM